MPSHFDRLSRSVVGPVVQDDGDNVARETEGHPHHERLQEKDRGLVEGDAHPAAADDVEGATDPGLERGGGGRGGGGGGGGGGRGDVDGGGGGGRRLHFVQAV
jgi:hypothetical protein